MDWLNDKKNQPIVIGAFVLIIIVAGYVVYKTNFSGGGSSPSASQSAPATSYPTMPGPGGTGAPPGGGPPNTAPYPTASPATPAPTATQPAVAPSANPSPQPGAAAARPAAGMMAKAMPMESYRTDPFLPIGYRPPPHQPKPIPHLDDLPIPYGDRPMPGPPGGGKVQKVEYAAQPMRRMAGLLRSGRIYAILETNGTSEVVQPGDRLNDGMATVDRIESDKVILKTTDKTPRYITVRMAGASHVDTSAPAGTPGTGMPPGMPPGAYPPGGGMPRGYTGGPAPLPRG